jgi:quinol monooxygenase YgiN
MAGPIVFISHQRVKPGRFDEFAAFFADGSKAIEAEKPGTVVFLGFTDADRGETRIVHVFPDADAMDRHMQGADERSAQAYQFLEPLEIDVYGSPSPGVVAGIEALAGHGVRVRLMPELVGGYHRAFTP